MTLRGFEQSSLNGRHEAAIGKFLASNDPSFLAPFIGKAVTDAKNKSHILETDPNTLYRLAAISEPMFPEQYRLTS